MVNKERERWSVCVCARERERERKRERKRASHFLRKFLWELFAAAAAAASHVAPVAAAAARLTKIDVASHVFVRSFVCTSLPSSVCSIA